jgi:hypothetical protein
LIFAPRLAIHDLSHAVEFRYAGAHRQDTEVQFVGALVGGQSAVFLDAGESSPA